MSDYDGCFVKLAGAGRLAFWAVDGGIKRPVISPEHMYQIGLRPIHVLSEEEFSNIPFAEWSQDEEE